jgi:hypothetical protein
MTRASESRLNRIGQMIALLCLWCGASVAAAAAPQIRSLIDIPYARVDGKTLLLDLHLPAGVERPPLVVYLHGGAWRLGDKTEAPPFLVVGWEAASCGPGASRPHRAKDILMSIPWIPKGLYEY